MSRTRSMLQQHPAAWGVGLAVVGAVFFSGKAIVIKLAYAYPVDGATLVAMRMLLSLPLFLAALAWDMWRNTTSPRLTAKDLGMICVAGLLGYYMASLFDFTGLQYITAGLERLILFTYPSMVVLIGCAINRHWPEPVQLACMLISYVGLAVVYSHEAAFTSEDTLLGSALVLLSALCYASYLLIGERLLMRLGTIRVTALATLVSAAAILVQISLRQPISVIVEQPAAVWGWSLINAVFCTFVPVFSVMTAMSLIGASRVAQIGMIGPVSTLILGTWILKEPFTVWHAIGASLVIAGVATLNLKKAKKE